MNGIGKKIELCANIAIVVFAILSGFFVVKQYLSMNPAPSKLSGQVKVGTKLSLAGVDWGKNQRSLLFALRKDCPACAESAPFYRRLADDIRNDTQLIALLAESETEGKKYVSELGLNVHEVKQLSVRKLGIMYAPTLILVNAEGTVEGVWVGTPTESKEFEIWNRMHSSQNSERASAQRVRTMTSNTGPQITSEDVKKRMKNGEHLVFLDVRSRTDYAQGHLQQARNIPVDELWVRAENELRKSSRIVLYCSCYNDYLSKIAHRALKKIGFSHVFILQGEIDEWRRAGLSIVSQ